MGSSIKLRRAKPKDAENLSNLSMRSKAYWGYSDEFMEACRNELTVSKNDINDVTVHYNLAELEKEVVGYYALKLLPSEQCDLEALFVEPTLIGKGIGRKLIQHAKRIASQNGAKRMIIQSDPNAADFYIAAGGALQGKRGSESVPGRYLPLLVIEI